ncbi:SMI1/KNR4 family protein [Lysinibacillus pakistanensis]|uniref:SMI1/KNR4 family protein n=1 Tax=Lysinibacillus pakistanensis TaxID=759811 RepID=A0AAX3X1L8_9BACI|nr:SMI1/KNR4 family protein [Lysinibacillus pakistanensis]MDM5233472.1 SMI1/KNR4 family protein [Lysinibacillus pakistanensis]WHY48944.1 SMI1/KNR4 family protein [Lysinibacillus pakistanensis]WHY53955.1 SMI1/KNR4 family protein [Lysinibacillus pakistanensis]
MRFHTPYFNGLMTFLPEEEQNQLQQAKGATDSQIQALLGLFPSCPESLIKLLQDINGTYFCKHGEATICVLVLGSDLGEYPYYLKSIEQMIKDNQVVNSESIYERYQDFLEYVEVDDRIQMHIPLNKHLCFADCMNNGGTSSLYIDFYPNDGGQVGQVVRYVHDPDSYEVIAPSFDDYLQQLIDGGFEFTAIYEEE